MLQPTQLFLPNTSHRNQGLFSDYYLDNILPKQWDILRNEATEVMAQLQKIYAKFTPNPNNEAQTEDDWIKPILRTLGHLSFEIQVPLDVPNSVQKPDYVFYKDEATRIAKKGKVVTEIDLKYSAYAIGDAKKWECSLDRTSKESDSFSNKNPSYQIFFYMLQSGISWGMLTNGRHWRLYHHQTAHKLEVFYEIDLPALLEKNNVDDFLYFYTFFRRGAFAQGSLTLEQILAASIEYARSISDNLCQQVYDALRYVAQGFFDYPENNLVPTPDMCKLIYDNSLTLLYRLLFILYAEARDLLPLHSNSTYQHRYSFHAIKNDIVTSLQEDLLATSGMVWSRLKALFHIINLGSPPLNVTTYNGGLFDPKRHDFLEHYVVGDLNLCRAIDKLARVKSQFVDYRDLAERHLGTIYEGLLEYKLKVAAEPMVELKSSSKIVPAQGISKKDIATAFFQQGEVYLVTDQDERKITGSYYTPDYIVKYMVDEALRSVLHEAVENAHTDAERIQAILQVNVLDPAMGSGHFPVEVVQYIARFLVEIGVQPEETEEADMAYWKRRVAQQCIYGVDINPLAVELAKLSLWLVTVAKDRPLSFLDHHLRVGNVLIGSWLCDITSNRSVGTRQGQKRAVKSEEKEKEAGQLSLLNDNDFRESTRIALDSITAIESNPGVTIKDVKDQETAYSVLRQVFSEKYLSLANLDAAIYFDTGENSKLLKPLVDYAFGKTVIKSTQFEKMLDEFNKLAEKRHFFHWELEFPDIFFDHQGQHLDNLAGFDVVIGNPPYVRQEQLRSDKPYLREHYQVYQGAADLFVYFFAQGLRLLRKGGKLVYICSNSWFRADYATNLRHYLRTQTTVETIIDLGDNRIFPDAPDLTPAIQVVCNNLPIDRYTAQAAVFSRGEDIKSFKELLAGKFFSLSIQDQWDTCWQIANTNLRSLFTNIMLKGKPLGDVIVDQMYLGIKTGLNDLFVINQNTRDHLVKQDAKCAELIKPMLRGEDLRPWYQENEGIWLICLPNGWTMRTFQDLEPNETLAWKHVATHYPGLAAYLQRFEKKARERQDQGQFWWELRPCDYYDNFEKPKIFWAPIGKRPRFSWDGNGQFLNNSGFFLLPTDISLLGILQSRVVWFWLSQCCTPLGERAGLIRYQQFIQFVKKLPIPPLTDAQHDQISNLANKLADVSQNRYQMRKKIAYRIQSDLGTSQAKLNQQLESWWELSFKQFRGELLKIFKQDIPIKDRDEWESFLNKHGAEIRQMTEEIVRLETELNNTVYEVFGLNEVEIKLIERETKYQYGEW